MREHKEDILDLYKKDFEGKIEEDEWEDLALKLEEVNFYHFRFVRFNIYYCSLIILTFLFSAGVFVDHYFFGEDQASKEQATGSPAFIEKKSAVTETINDSAGKAISALPKKKKKNTPTPISKVAKSSLIISDDPINTPSGNKEESPSKSDPYIEPALKKDSILKKKPKNVVYITRQDTIVIYDTLITEEEIKKK